jgi:hypothetical protein
MPTIDPQLLATIFCVLAAAAWLGWRVWRGLALKRAGGCAGCPQRAAPKAEAPAGFVGLDDLRQSARDDPR